MSDTPQARIKRNLADLLPRYMHNRHKDIALAREAVARSDFTMLRGIGHRLKGSGSSYGFHHITALGELLEQASQNADAGAAARLIDDLERYLSNVRIELI